MKALGYDLESDEKMTSRSSGREPYTPSPVPLDVTEQEQIQPQPHGRLIRRLKNLVLPRGVRPYRLRGGLMRGRTLELDLQHQLQIWLGLSERELIPWFRRYTQGIRSAVDVGAAEGRYTIPLLFAGTPKVIACEPTLRVGGLHRNLRLNGIDPEDARLEYVRSFVGPATDENMVTLDSLFDRVELPCLIKMDVEGAEAGVLAGAGRFLSSQGVSWIIETHSAKLEEECVLRFQEAGLEPHIVLNAPWRSLVPMKGVGPVGHGRWLAATSNPAHQ